MDPRSQVIQASDWLTMIILTSDWPQDDSSLPGPLGGGSLQHVKQTMETLTIISNRAGLIIYIGGLVRASNNSQHFSNNLLDA